MVGGFKHTLDKVFIACFAALCTHSTTSLCAIFNERRTLNITEVRNSDNHWVVGVEVLCVHFLSRILDFGLTLVAKLFTHLNQFIFNHLAASDRIVENVFQECDTLAQFFQLVAELVLLKIGELTQTHFHDSASLSIIEFEAFRQALTRLVGVLTAADDVNHLIDMVRCDNQALQNVSTVECLLQLESCATNHHFVTVIEEVLQNLLQVHGLWSAIHQTHIINTERRLQFCHLIELIEKHIRILVLLHINHDTHTLAVTFVVDVADAFNLLFLHQSSDSLNQFTLVHVVRNFTHHNLVAVVFGFDFCFRTNHHASASGLKCVSHALIAMDDTTCWEVGGFDELHQVGNLHFWIFEQCQARVNRLGEVVRWHIGCHTHRNTATAIHQQVRESGWKHLRFFEGVVEVGVEIHGVFVQVAHHFLTHLCQTGLGVTHSRRAVAVDRTKVTLTIY